MMLDKKFILLTIGCMFCVTILVVWFTKKRYNSERVSMSWSYEGQPYVVTGKVVDQNGNPISGLFIDLGTDSGGRSVYTDESGHFSRRVDEMELTGIDLGIGPQREDIFFRPIMGLRLDEGIAFDIKFKSPPPGMLPQ